MICKYTIEQYCKDPIEWIENYEEAVNDTEQTWHCHHRYEIEYHLSKIELQAMDFYFNRPFDELIFLTQKDHVSLHNKGRIAPNKGKQLTEEWKQKLSESGKGNQNSLKYHITKEELYSLYILQGLSQSKIAKMYGCSQFCILQKLKKFDIRK